MPPNAMARVFRKHVCTKGKPYRFVGWGTNKEGRPCPRFAPKDLKQYEKELAEMMMNQDTPNVGEAREKQVTCDGFEIFDGPSLEITNDKEDGDLLIKQMHPLVERTLRFGPLKTSLSDLMEKDNYWLECLVERKQRIIHSTRPVRVYLTNGIDRYKLYSIEWSKMQIAAKIHGQYDLAGGIPDKMNLMRTHSSALYPKPIIQRVEVKTIIERDPFEVLAERYPRKRRQAITLTTMVGNRTLGERLKDLTD